ncbi:CASP-like protein 1C1 [Citrus sinensis]|uniref:CASP-like protein 1C1 n=1 Tax=Citrus sinensis TaxID=2711 RepID=A0ACB8N537_CITSI|nr:CASP-like protein 1C1 [Citrus sinensis]
MAFGATLYGTIVMATSHEIATFFAVSFEAKYSVMPAFKFFVIANAIVSIYGFLVLFLPLDDLAIGCCFDMLFTMLLTSSISAALTIAQVGKKENSSTGWLSMCH